MEITTRTLLRPLGIVADEARPSGDVRAAHSARSSGWTEICANVRAAFRRDLRKRSESIFRRKL